MANMWCLFHIINKSCDLFRDRYYVNCALLILKLFLSLSASEEIKNHL